MRGVNKYIVVFLSGVFAVVAIVVGMKYSTSKIPKIPIANDMAVEEQTKLAVNDLFLDQNHIFLAEDMTEAFINEVKETVDENNAEEMALLTQADQKWSVQKQLNKLYLEPILIGSRINENATLVDGVTEDDKQRVATSLESSNITDEFASTVKGILTSGETSSSVSTESVDSAFARERLKLVVQDGVVTPNFTLESYNNARDAIAVLPVGSERSELTAQLKLVENAMDQMGVAYESLPPAN